MHRQERLIDFGIAKKISDIMDKRPISEKELEIYLDSIGYNIIHLKREEKELLKFLNKK